MDGKMPRRMVGLKDGHAVFSSGHDEGFETQVAASALAVVIELSDVSADSRMVGSFDLGFVRGGGGDAGVAIFEEAVTRIERHALGMKRTSQRRRGRAQTVIGDQDRAGAAGGFAGF